MEHRLLMYFLAVCEELHFTRAAEKLGISQPTLSHQIQRLEQEIGAALFHRIGKKTYIAEAGEILRRHALRSFHELEQAQQAIHELRGMKRGRLRIGCSGNHLLASTLPSFHRQYPAIELSVSELSTEETCAGLLDNVLDLGVTFLPVAGEQLETIPLYYDELQLAAAADHPLAAVHSVTLQELQPVPLLLLQQKFLLRQWFDACCSEAGFVPKPAMELSTLESLLQMARSGAGAAVLPATYTAGIHDTGIRFVSLTGPTPRRTLGLVHRRDSFMSAALRAFISHLCSGVPPLNGSGSGLP